MAFEEAMSLTAHLVGRMMQALLLLGVLLLAGVVELCVLGPYVPSMAMRTLLFW